MTSFSTVDAAVVEIPLHETGLDPPRSWNQHLPSRSSQSSDQLRWSEDENSTISRKTERMGTPFHTERIPQSEEVDRARGATFNSIRILLVDDDISVREMLALVLGRAGYSVSCAGDGENAWDVYCRERFDVLVTDHLMPSLTGVQLLRKIRSASQDFPVILMSAVIPWQEDVLTQLLSPGLALEKPFSADVLLASVYGLVDGLQRKSVPIPWKPNSITEGP